MAGLTKGLQLVADFLKYLLKAIERGVPEAVIDGRHVAEAWIADTVDATGKVKVGAWSMLTGDPWKKSRQVYRDFEFKWKGRL